MPGTSEAKVALVTGALSDIGRATAQALARAGYAVVVNYRRHPEQAQALADSLVRECNAPQAVAIQADIRERAQIQALFDQIYQTFGRLDVLVNNAGINQDRPFLDMSDDAWEMVISTVLTGTFRCSQEFARRYTGDCGNIVNIGAITAIKGRKNGANYCSARAGVLVLTKCLALELAPRIRVNTVTPGRINTDELRARYGLDDVQILSRMEQEVPLARLGQPDDVAGMIAFIVTAGHYVTGQNFFVDGGLFMR